MEQIFREHHEWALRVARRVVGRAHDAEDIVSEVFVATLRAIEKGGGPKDNIRGYLKRAIQNEATRVYARRQREIVTDELPEVETPDPTDAVDRSLTRAARLRDAPPDWKAIIFHVDICGLSAKEASLVLGMTEYAAVSTLHRARTALRLAV